MSIIGTFAAFVGASAFIGLVLLATAIFMKGCEKKGDKGNPRH